MNSWAVIKPNSIIIPNDGDIGSAGANDAIQIDSGGIVTFKDDIKIKDGGTIGTGTTANAVTIAADGTVTLVGNLVVDNTKGIDFSATANAPEAGTTMDSELLDDYEEGEWTPAYGSTGSVGTVGYGSRSGQYVKIGRVVHIFWDMSTNAHSGSVSGYLTLTGLPFSVSNDVDETAGSVGRANGWASNPAKTLQFDGGSAFAFINSDFDNSMCVPGDIDSSCGFTGQATYLH